MYVLLTLQTIANIINSNNDYLMLIQQHKYKSEDIIKPTWSDSGKAMLADATNATIDGLNSAAYLRKNYLTKPLGRGINIIGDALQ